MTIEELLKKLQEISDLGETRSLTEDEVSKYEELEGQLKAAQKTAELRSRTAAYVAPNASLQAGIYVATPKEDDTEERAFASYLRTGKPNADLETRAQTVGTDAAGGYLVPETLLNRIETRMKAFGGVAAEVETLTTDGGELLKINTADDTANKAVIVGENTAPSTGGADLAWGQFTIGAHTWTTSGASQAPISVTWQLVQDSQFDINAYVVNAIAERFARGQADAWVKGTGSSQPFGLITNTTTEATFTAATIDKDELISALHKVDPAYRTDAIWIFNDATLEKIRKLEDDNGRPLWTPAASAGLEGSIGGTLLGHRVVIDQAFADYVDGGTNKWGVFGNVRAGYMIRRVSGMRLLVDQLSGKSEARIEYAAHQRADGNVKQPRAYAVLKNAA